MNRCPWCTSDPEYIKYHDEEWGKPVYDDKTLFEFLVLESAQAGLSWLTVLKRRSYYRIAYSDFDVHKVAAYTEENIQDMLDNSGIIKHRKKIESSISNAKLFIEIQKEYGSFSDFLWQYVNHQPIINHFTDMSQVPVSTDISDRLSKDLKKRGFKFIGTTIMYAYMEAVGMVNDHIATCHCYEN